jgi:hypothetical protein
MDGNMQPTSLFNDNSTQRKGEGAVSAARHPGNFSVLLVAYSIDAMKMSRSLPK